MSEKTKTGVVANELRSNKKPWIYSLGLVLFLLCVLTVIYNNAHNKIINDRATKQFNEVAEMRQKISEEISAVAADLVYFSHSSLALETLAHLDPSAKEYLASLMRKIGELKKSFDQIRVLDAKGKEVIRLNQRADQTMAILAETELQNKSDRYYFKDASALPPEHIYLSRFDLNQENGQVQLPLNPVIRLATPIHSAAGQLLGVGLLNYRGNRLYELLNKMSVHEGDLVYLLNDAGYYLWHPNHSKEWGFMLPERSAFNFAKDNPQAWNLIHAEETGSFSLASGEYYFSTFELAPSADFKVTISEKITLLMHVPSRIIDESSHLLLVGLALVFLVLAPILVFLGWKLGVSQNRQAQLLSKLAFEARHDALTGLENRKAIMEHLEREVLRFYRNKKPLSVGFIDVNYLKRVNDRLGHEQGDEMIKGAAKAILDVIRCSDNAARIGGDEFLIVLPECSIDGANQTMQRIEKMFASFGRRINADWSLSYGCSQLENDDDSAEKAVARADAKMYQFKQAQRQTVKP